MSLLSMPTFRRLAETDPMSFSESQDLKSFTAKHAETPEQMHEEVSAVANRPARIKLGLSNRWVNNSRERDLTGTIPKKKQ